MLGHMEEYGARISEKSKEETKKELEDMEKRINTKIEAEAARVLREIRATNGVLVIKAEMALENAVKEMKTMYRRRLYTDEVEKATAKMNAEASTDEVFYSESSATADKLEDLEASLLRMKDTLDNLIL